MFAVVYHGPGNKDWEEVPDPQIIDDTDAIVRVDSVTICGTDLHILKGDVPAVTDGRILGHEGVEGRDGAGARVDPFVRLVRTLTQEVLAREAEQAHQPDEDVDRLPARVPEVVGDLAR